jgi:hypothetical protein
MDIDMAKVIVQIDTWLNTAQPEYSGCYVVVPLHLSHHDKWWYSFLCRHDL